jgi:hypothetical protein
MKTPEDLFLSEQVNLAHLLALAGMIREHMSARQADIFTQQIYMQTDHLIPNEECRSANFETLRGIDFKFLVPISCVVDVSGMLMDVGKSAEVGTSLHAAVMVLAGMWRPFAMAGMLEIDKIKAKQDTPNHSEFGLYNREFPPNSHN